MTAPDPPRPAARQGRRTEPARREPAADRPVRVGRFRRAAARVAAAAGLTVVFTASTLAAVVLHLDSAPSRRIIQRSTNLLLGSLFEGKIIAGEIEHIDLDGVVLKGAAAVDPNGQPVIVADRLRAEADLIEMARRGLFGEGPLEIEIPYIRIEHADVLVEESPLGSVTIADTFQMKPEPPEPEVPPPPTAPPRPVRVSMKHIEIGTGWAHGRVVASQILDADVTRLVGGVFVTETGVRVSVEQTSVLDRRFLPAVTQGSASYDLTVTFAPKGQDDSVVMWSNFAGRFGELPVVARANLDNGYLSAVADVPKAEPSQVLSVLPDLFLSDDVSARVELSGPIPHFDVDARVELKSRDRDPGVVTVSGGFDAEELVRYDLVYAISSFDLQSISSFLPHSRLYAKGSLRGEVGGPVTRLGGDLRSEPTVIEGQAVPAVDAHVTLDRGLLHVSTHIEEEGMPIDGGLVLDTSDLGVRFFAKTRLASLRVPRLGAPIDGAATIEARGHLEGGRLSADVNADVRGLRAEGLELAQGQLSGRVEGQLDALEVSASLTGRELQSAGTFFEEVKARATGPIARPRVSAELTDRREGHVTAAGALDTERGAAYGVRFTVERKDARAEGTIDKVGADAGGLAIEGISVEGEGFGGVSGDLRVSRGELVGHMSAEAIDLQKLATLLGVPDPVGGIASLDVKLERTPRGRTGHVQLQIEDGSALIFGGLSTHLTATFEDDEVALDGLFRVVARAPESSDAESYELCDGTIAEVLFKGGRAELKGPLLAKETWLGAIGRIDVRADDWSLRCLAELVPFGLPVSDVDGRVTTRFSVERGAGDAFPSVKDVYVRTRGLSVSGPQGFGDDEPAWASTEIDVQIKGGLDGRTGSTTANAVLFDGNILADATATLELDLDALATDPRADFLATPVTGKLTVPRRKIADFRTLPTFVRDAIPPLDGEVRLDGYADGTVGEPFLAVTVRGLGLTYRPAEGGLSDWSIPIDVDGTLTYESGEAGLDAEIAHGGQNVATINAMASVMLSDLIDPPAEGVPWTGGVYADLTSLPLAAMPVLSDRGIGGHLDGTISVGGINERPSLDVDLHAEMLQVGPEFYADTRLTVVIEPIAKAATAQLPVGAIDAAMAPREKGVLRTSLDVQPESGGRLSALAYSGVLWESRLYPTLDPDAPADLSVVAEEFSLAAFEPLVLGDLSKLEGIIDGHARVGWGRVQSGDQGSVDAYLRVSSGVVHVPQLGQELRNASMVIIGNPAGVLRFDEIQAEGLSGRVQGSALLRLDGLRPTRASGEIRIASDEKLPISLEGVPLGQAYGQVGFDAQFKEHEVAVLVKVPTLHVDLPAATARDVQSLDEHPDVVLSHPLGPEEAKRSADAAKLVFDLDLGEVQVEGAGIEVTLTSGARKPRIVLTDVARFSGDIQLVSGYFDVLGKTFQIERGLVRLRQEDTSNPYLNVTAFWDAPAGGRIYVDYVGILKPVTDDKLNFRSDPPRPKRDILAAIILGKDLQEAETSSGQGTAGDVAAGVGGELASEQFNALLKGIAPLRGLSTRFGTTEEGAVKGSLVYQRGSTVAALSAYRQEDPSTTGQGPTTATQEPDAASRAEVSVDWGFTDNWSLRGTFGVGAGSPTSGVDLIWQYRY